MPSVRRARSVCNLTQAKVRNLEPPTSGRPQFHYDEKQAGLAISVATSGAKVWYWCGRAGGRYTRERIGAFPSVTVAEARKQAQRIVVDVQAGRYRRVKGAITLQGAFESWRSDAVKRKVKKLAEYDRLFKRHLSPLAKRQLKSISRDEVEALHRKIGEEEKAPYVANRVLEFIRAIFLNAKGAGKVDGNHPAYGITRFKETERTRYVQAHELPRLIEHIRKEPPILSDYWHLLIYTGARRGSVLAMRWADISTEARVWAVPESKAGEPVFIPLVDEAIEILLSRSLSPDRHPVRVFPMSIGRVWKSWCRVRDGSGLTDLRIHDLRRSLGSWMANLGSDLQAIGKALGHKSTRSTHVYARMKIDVTREQVQKATAAMRKAGGASDV